MTETGAEWRAPLRVPRFRALWLGGALSWYGDFLTLPALVIICYDLGGELAVGLLFVSQMVPALALLPIGGRLGDRGDRRRRLVALDMVRASLAGLTIVAAEGHLLFFVLIATAAARSASALYDPGRRRLVAVLLPPAMVAAGSSLLSVVSETALFVAPGLGALLMLIFHLQPVALITVDGLTFLLSAVLIQRIGPQPAQWGTRAYTRQPVWPSLRRGFELLLFEPTTRLFAVQAALGAALASVIQVYFVPLARYTFHAGTNQVGVMYVVVGIASVLASAVAVRLPKVSRRSVVIIGYVHLAVAALVGMMLGAGLVVAAVVVFAGSGALQEVWGFNRIQTRTPSEGVGQAMGAGLWCMYLGRALGAVAATWGATHLSRQEFMIFLTIAAVALCLVVSLAGQFHWRRNVEVWPPGGPSLPF
ncbi:MAG: MFS transporter [Candidatus Dormiibacterota bacterium]